MPRKPSWTAEEDKLLAQLCEQPLSDTEIAASLPGRSANAICQRRRVLRLPKLLAKEIRSRKFAENRAPNLVERLCKVCAATFIGARNAVTCSPACRRKLSSQLQNSYDRQARPILVGSCKVCGKGFRTSKSQQITCSAKCARINDSQSKERSRIAAAKADTLKQIKSISTKSK